MDTRSVVRSRRRSTRLTGQSLQDERMKRPTTSKRRDSGHDASSISSSNASREPSCPRSDATSKNALSSHDAHPATEDTKATKASVKAEDSGVVLPLFPNLPSSKAKATGIPRAKIDSIIAAPKQPDNSSSVKPVKDHVSTKWAKTARGSIRLASDSPAGASKNDADKKCGEVHQGQNALSATARRRSRRLASMTPDVEDDEFEVEPVPSRRPTALKAKALAPDTSGSGEHQEPEPDSQDLYNQATTEQDPSPHPTHHDELLIHDGKPDRVDQGPEVLRKTYPIPELVADIEKIVQSSPLADRNTANDGTQSAMSSTPTQAFKNRPPANIFPRSRTLRSSARSIENTDKMGKSLGSEEADSESSQFDGAFDDTMRARRKRKGLGGSGTANTFKPKKPRGIKRNAKELSEAEGNADSPGLRQRRKPDSDGSKPEVDLSSSNPIEAATSRDAFSVDDPSVENAVDIGEFARRTDEPANPVMLAQMISTDPEGAGNTNDSTSAGDGFQGAGQLQSPEGDAHKCADCGRSPERYLVCAKCQEAVYCGKYCQIWDWPLHKTRCHASNDAVQSEINVQEAYLGDMWAAALKMLKEENMAGGTIESLLLGEAVQHSPTRPAFMGQGSPRGFVRFDVHSSQSSLHNSQSVDRTGATSIRLAQAAQGGDE